MTIIANKIKTRIAIYVRTSRTDQVLENQILPLKQYCKAMSYTYEIFEEQESTRKTRPIQWDLYQRLLKKQYDGLLIYKFDRWARSSQELVTHMNELTGRGIRFISYTENIDLGTSTGKLMFQIIAAFAEFERNMIRERTMAGLDRARAQGKKLGRPTKGKNYTRPSRAQVSELMGKGMTIRQIAKQLKTSKYWANRIMIEVGDSS